MGSFRTKVTVYNPKALKVKEFVGSMLALHQNDIGPNAKKLLNQTTSTWDGAKPVFSFKYLFRGGSAFMEFYIASGGSELNFGGSSVTGADKWWWLNEGTSIRRVRMQNGFRPKTRVRQMQSVSGGGNPVGWARLPGIDAREWDKELNDQTKQGYAAKVQALVNRYIG